MDEASDAAPAEQQSSGKQPPSRTISQDSDDSFYTTLNNLVMTFNYPGSAQETEGSQTSRETADLSENSLIFRQLDKEFKETFVSML